MALLKFMRYKNRFFERTLLSIGDGIISIDINRNIVFMNGVAENLTGWCMKDAIGKPIYSVFNIINEYSRKNDDDIIEKVFSSKSTHYLTNHTILISKDSNENLIEDSVAPILNKHNKIMGVVVVFRDYSEKAENLRKIEFLNFHDDLTGLYNRRFFEEECKRLDTTRNYPLSIIMADLNCLKLVNDSFGHLMGDKLLIQAASLLKMNLRGEDIAARWGGDEFVILMPQTSINDAEKIIKRIIKDMSKLYEGQNILSIAFGCATKIDSGIELNKVFKNAEEVMYSNKTNMRDDVRDMTMKIIIDKFFEKIPRERINSQGVKEFSVKIAKALNLSQQQIDDIEKLALLHNIGGITLPIEIFEKTEKLIKSEFDEIKRHPSIGYRMLINTYEFSGIAKGVLHHHERWDGKGYPEGIKGDNIPIESRIISIAAAFNAMTETRPYKDEPLTFDQAKLELKKNAGSQFDPKLVDLIIKGDVL